MSKKTYLFSYGSNHPEQLSERLERKLDINHTHAAYMVKTKRSFVGYSKNWGGGVATIVADPKRSTYGYVTSITENDIAILDYYEGVSVGKYKRKKGKVIAIIDDKEVKLDVIYYVATSKEYNRPSDEYLSACLKTINTFFSDNNGKDFTLAFMKSLLPKNKKGLK